MEAASGDVEQDEYQEAGLWGWDVVFEGEFYGPQVPDRSYRKVIRKNYHPGWDHLSASMTKMVVYSIQRVKPLPSDQPCEPPKSDPHQWPCWQNPAPVDPASNAGVSHESGRVDPPK